MPWDQVIIACAEHMLAHLNSHDLWVSGVLRANDDNSQRFTLPTRWMQAQAETSLSSVAQVTTTPSTFRKRYGGYQIEKYVAWSRMSGYQFRHRRHQSDPPFLPVSITSHYTPSSGSLSVGVSPAATGGSATTTHSKENSDENKLKKKLEKSIEMEKALSQRHV